MSHPHIVAAFDKELQTLVASIGAMGDFAGTQFVDAVHALLHRELELSQRVVDQDRQLDALRRDLSAAAAGVIARRQPLASDLDEILADFRIVEDLERVGDLAKNIAKRAVAVAGHDFPEDIVASLEQLAEMASSQLKGALAAYAVRDAGHALAVRKQDEEIDRLHTSVFRNIVARMNADQTQVVPFVHLLFCAKNIERVGDHATHIAEAAYLLATGYPPDGERRRLDESSNITGDTFVGEFVLKP